MSRNQRKRCKLADTASNINSAVEEADEDLDQFELLLQQMEVESENNNLAYTIRRTMLEIAQIKERNCERRHSELMALLKNSVAGDSSSECRTITDESFDTTDAHGLISKEKTENKAEKTEIAECTVNKVEPNTHTTMTASMSSPSLSGLQNRKNEYHEQRQRLIALQKQKMADRERKKQEQERQNNKIQADY